MCRKLPRLPPSAPSASTITMTNNDSIMIRYYNNCY